MKNSITDQLNACLKKGISNYAAHDVISPANLAAQAINMLDPGHASVASIEWGCNLKLRDMAAALMRKTLNPAYENDADSGQIDLFAGLQDRYPAKRNGGAVYVNRMDLTLDERMANISRMKKEVSEKQKHIDAFTRETQHLMESGYFAEEQSA